MSFVSMMYLLFVAAGVLVYYMVPAKWQWAVLLVFSYVFYAWSGPKLLAFLLLTTFTTYGAALWIEKIRSGEGDKKKKVSAQRRVLTGCLLINFGVLFLLKYAGFSADVMNRLFHMGLSVPQWALPLGISFYTFQSLGYVIDVYWNRTEAEHNPFRHMLFVSFFPQILQGPIGRHSRLAAQFRQEHAFDLLRIQHGLQRMFWGYFLKFVLADRAADAVNHIVAGYTEYTGAMYAFAVLMYSIQLYGDFAGGMDVVIGTAELFGITLDENFRQPYFATSISDFWHRWHITLGSWMKDYLFYPFSLTKTMLHFGKRVKKRFGKQLGRVLPVAVANIVVFLAVGIWHGAGGKYLMYGLYNGVLISLEALTEPYTAKLRDTLHIAKDSRLLHGWKILWTFFLVNVSWFWDIAPDLKTADHMLLHSFTDFRFSDLTKAALMGVGINTVGYVGLAFGLAVLIPVSLLKENGHKVREDIDRMPLIVRWGLYLALIFSMIIIGKYSAGGFIYAQF